MFKRMMFFVVFLLLLSSFIAGPANQALCADNSSFARAKGHGTVTFTGSGSISVDGDGVLYVNESPEVEAVGRFNFFEDEADGRRVYVVQKEATTVSVAGSDMEVSFSGANISFIAEGSGEMTVKGYGIYLEGLSFGIWTPEGTRIKLGN